MTLAAAPPLIRPAAPGATEAIHRLVVELAVYEREPDAVEATPADFTSALFAENPIVFCHVAEDRASGMIIGFSLWFVSFSTWRGTTTRSKREVSITGFCNCTVNVPRPPPALAARCA